MGDLVVGLDAAAQLKNCGYSIGWIVSGRVEIEEAGLLDQGGCIALAVETLVSRLEKASRALIAIDAPLGWPASMGHTLAEHRAGEVVGIDRGALFRRRTDDVVRERTGKKPLEVGAEKIAHASHRALEILETIRQSTGLPIPLAWSPGDSGVRAIEVYPGATLFSRFDEVPPYKTKLKTAEEGAIEARRKIAFILQSEISGLDAYSRNPSDVFDACLCLLAAKDFRDGSCCFPDDIDLARKEGWIWVRPRAGR